VEIGDLARRIEGARDSQLTLEQERETSATASSLPRRRLRQPLHFRDPRHVRPGQVFRASARPARQVEVHRARAGNRIRLLVSRTFAWPPDGPIQFFRARRSTIFRSRFDREGELMLFVNSMLSKGSAATMIERLKQVANECSALHNEDVGLPLDKRFGHSLLVAIRPWNMEAFKELERGPAAGAGVQVRRNVLAK
jgi:hypothetical protein